MSVSFLIAARVPVNALSPSASTSDNLNGVVMLDTSNGWAVGNEGTIQHFDGSSWSLIASGTTTDLFGLSFGPPGSLSPNAGFAVGGSGGVATALYWSGTSWFPISTGLSGAGAVKLSSVFALSATDAWAVDSVSGAFWHWSGSAGLGGGWIEVSSAPAGLNSVFMTSPTDGWAVGDGGIIYRYSGGGWTLYTTASQTLNSVYMIDQDEGWAVGVGGAIYHYTSGVWTGPVSPGSGTQDLNSVFMISQSEGWAVGASGTILHYTGGQWTLIQNQLGTNQDLNSVYFAGTVGWAVGNAGTILSINGQTLSGLPSGTFESVYLSDSSDGWIVGCSTGGCGSGTGEPVLVHWTGNGFTRGTASAITSDLLSVFMVSSSEGWAVGGIGATPVILQYTGGTWTQVNAPPITGLLRSVFMTDSNDGWAVGDGGVILKYTGGTWGQVTSPTSNTLRSVFMLDSSDGWAVGDSGTILRYESGVWQNYASPTSAKLNDVNFLDSTHGWAVGAGGVILNFGGTIWLTVADSVSANLNSVYQTNAQSAWAVGDSATILQWNGIGWYQYFPSPPLSSNPNLNSIYILPGGFGFAVGAPSGPGSQGIVISVPSMTPIPDLNQTQTVLGVLLLTVAAMISIHRRKPKGNQDR
ncbi:MAG TPA: hypothetical protein VLV31_12635 [Candidatus Acidoferrales bacterium]|nr:hypothetical protein [Candidatus Acidoferrales bacterium]